LSKAQSDRAASIARISPADYELDRNGALAVRGEVLVSGLNDARLARIERAGFRIVRQSEIPDLGISLAVVIHDGMSAAQIAERLRRTDPDGSYDLNHVYFESRGRPEQPSSSRSPLQEGDGRAATVGMIDTGVAKVVDSPGRVRVVRRSFNPGQGSVSHGTAVASLLAREPGPVTIYSADVFGAGPRGGTAELLARALGWMAGEHVPVINVSMVGPSNGLVAAATRAMIARGYTIVAPVGNDGPAARPLYPASYPGVIAVSAADSSGRLLPESSRVKRTDFVGPGIATVPDLSGRATVVRGTSFAAPIVSRKLADLLTSPDPLGARRALMSLSNSAIPPRADRSFLGRGLIGIEFETTKRSPAAERP
jgi:subtilisin family serine protease